jgi:sulfoxide reductase catalytic subunit YedY
MLMKSTPDLRESEVTPRDLYLRRREFIGAAGVAAAALATGVVTPGAAEAQNPSAQKLANLKKSSFSTTETMNSYRDVTTYNNFYEFGLDKGDPARHAHALKPRPWSMQGRRGVRQAGHLQPRRHPEVVPARRAHLPHALRRGVVDGHSVGRLPAGRLREALRADLEGEVRRVHARCSTCGRCRGRREPVLAVALREGLRMDEAMHPLTMLAVGLYGEVLPNQNGAPLRLVVPWKYGFKGVKSIVSVKFVEKDAAEHLAADARRGIRLLRQREPRRRSPALDAEDRAPHRRVLPPQDAAVQRLRRSGGVALRGNGPAQVLLSRRARHSVSRE